ncbi:MAG: DUF1273 family protein [Clostridia bacterium]|nr:DUF1273 family protein [Clostridia bacterium]
MNQSCCFTGYRPHRFAFSPDGLRPEQVQAALGEQIRRLYDEGYRTFISGMSAGVDLWAAAEVIALRESHPEVELIAAVPFAGQESHWSIPQQREYRRILDAAQQVEYLFDAAAAEENAAECYKKRNRWMVDRADTVLAVCEIDVADSRTGTAATVRYARRQQKRIFYIHPVTLAVTEETVQQIEFPM